jgi:RNA polymerase sigma factor (sigma-70 family)
MQNAVQLETGTREPRDSESEIMKQHAKRIRWVAQPFARRGVVLNDLMQEGFIALLGAARSFDPNKGAELWTYAKKFVLGAMFRFVTREAIDGTVGVDELEDIESDEPSPESILDVAECSAIAAQELSHLNETERRLLRLRFVDDLDVRSIATSLGMPTMSAYDIYRDALSKLRARVEARV